jgi:hypothetical protein
MGGGTLHLSPTTDSTCRRSLAGHSWSSRGSASFHHRSSTSAASMVDRPWSRPDALAVISTASGRQCHNSVLVARTHRDQPKRFRLPLHGRLSHPTSASLPRVLRNCSYNCTSSCAGVSDWGRPTSNRCARASVSTVSTCLTTVVHRRAHTRHCPWLHRSLPTLALSTWSRHCSKLACLHPHSSRCRHRSARCATTHLHRPTTCHSTVLGHHVTVRHALSARSRNTMLGNPENTLLHSLRHCLLITVL